MVKGFLTDQARVKHHQNVINQFDDAVLGRQANGTNQLDLRIFSIRIEQFTQNLIQFFLT